MSVLAAPNLIVDSNAESPSTYAPKAVHFGVEICNNGNDDLSEVFINIGDYSALPVTPGIYRQRTVAESTYGGTFSFIHSGNTGDATRYIKTLAAGECTVQYWLIEYPNLDAGGNSVTGGSKPVDDLWLEYDIWATADDNGAALSVNETNTAYMRSEISAMANKIWPNGTNKVPQQYLDAIEGLLGWNPQTGSGFGESIRLDGLWFDLGRVNKGFDNNGDYIPDFNVFMQPVGDPDAYDANCFRLVKTYGLVVVKKNDGTEQLIPFEDQIYFENLAQNNNGAVGLVYYEFIALNGPCSSELTPYQEVASGSDNEKFNGDYGTYIPQLTSTAPSATLDDTGVASSPLNAAVEFNVTLTNTSGGDLGLLEYGLPVVMATDIPTGTEYISGSAALNNTLPTGITATILYSTDGGNTWSSTEPVTASEVTNIQWWMSDVIPDTEVVNVTFQTLIPAAFPNPTLTNIGTAGLGGGASFLEDNHTVLVEGNNTLSGTAFEDDGGTTGIKNDAIQNGDESGLQNIDITLYLDTDNDGTGDILIATQASIATGDYAFNNLPDGSYIVETSTDLSSATCGGSTCTGWVLGSENSLTVDLDAAGASGTGVTVSDSDFGFIPALSVSKTSNDGATVYEDNLISYDISLTNNSFNTSSGEDAVTAWAETTIASTFVNPANVLGSNGPDGNYTSSVFTNNDNVQVNGFNYANYTCAINSVEVVFQVYLDGLLSNDIGNVSVTVAGTTTAFPVSTASLNVFAPGVANEGELTIDLTSLRSWNWSDFNTGFDINFSVDKVNAGDGVSIFVDAIGLKINRDNTTSCIPPSTFNNNTVIGNIPLVDTYDATKLEYVSASIEPDATTAGSLTWNNIMSLIPGETGVLTVYFKPLEPADLVNGDLTKNTVNVTGATFLDGSAANDAAATADVTILNSGTITGSVWSDNNSTGWLGTTGYEGGEPLVPNTGIVLHRCDNLANNGNCNVVAITDTIYTDESGNYAFDGLIPNTHYQVEILKTTLPGITPPIQYGDPDDDPANGSGNGGTCGSGGSNAACTDTWDNGGSWFEIGIDSWGSQSFDITNINFGYGINSALQGVVWSDDNNDGTQGIGENGISNVTVELQYLGCVVGVDCPVSTTDINGNYLFEDLVTTLNYTIVIVESSLPVGGTWTETAETDGSANNSITKTLGTGEVSGGNNFGYHQGGTSSIGDIVFIDWDADGVHGANEDGISGVSVNLYEDANGNGLVDKTNDALIGTVVTSTTGAYNFTNLPAGNYLIDIVESTISTLYEQTADPDDVGACITCDGIASLLNVDGSSTYSDIDFGYQPTGGTLISGLVWQDANGDSILLSESTIENVTIALWADVDGNGTYTLVATTLSDANGNYTFSNLPDGDYQVIVSTTDTDIPSDAFGNPSVSTTGSTYDLTILNREVTSVNSEACTNCTDDFDFGFAKLGAIGNSVYSDANGNGAQDWTENGLEYVTVYLCDAASGSCNSGTALQTAVTDATGNYLFTGLAPNDYTVAVDAAALGAQTADPDRDGETCLSTTYPGLPACNNQMTDITLGYGTSFMGANFGYQAAGVIGDFIWLDADGDGIQGAGEPGIGDVEVTLTNATAVTIDGIFYAIGAYVNPVNTDLDGYYTYSDLPDGTYDIVVTTPIDRTATYDADGVPNGATQVVISGGTTTIAGNACTDCSLNADFGYKLNGAFSLSGSTCIDDGSEDGTCGTGGETSLEGTTVFIYNDAGEFLGETTTDVSGNYTFGNLPADTYIIAVGTTTSPLKITETTTAAATETTSSVYQTQAITTSNISGLDFGFKYNVDLDYGDLPASYNVTRLDKGGAYHTIITTPTLFLGNGVSSETAPSQNIDANGDTSDDGVVFNNTNSWTEGINGGNVEATIAGTGWLVGWIDFNQDGDISDAGEMIISQSVSTSTSTINFDIPSGANLAGSTYSRFRLFESEPPFARFSYIGEAANGEIEDYRLSFAALPVDLIAFTAKDKDCTINLYWQTATEENFQMFGIERSSDGVSFKTIGQKLGSGGATNADYHYLDQQATFGLNYYRLKLIDVTTAYSYSEIISVELDCDEMEKKMLIYPNPLMNDNSNKLNLKLFSSTSGDSEIIITDVTARVLKKIIVNLDEDWYTLQIDVSEFPAGTYFISHIYKGKVKTHQFVKMKK